MSPLHIAGLSHTGNKRCHNEDSIGIDDQLGLAVLADGLGGYQGGQIASALAVKIVIEDVRARYSCAPKALETKAGDDWHRSVLKEAFTKANGVIYHLAKRNPHWQGMGTTLIAALFHDDRVTVGHVGDSRLYRVRRNELQRITVDHSLLQELVDGGFCYPEDLRCSLNKNLITRAVGVDQSVHPDMKQEPVISRDLYLLCSDGLTDLVEDQEIQLTLRESRSELRKAAVSLVRLANRRGGHDNISVIIARCSETSAGVFQEPKNPS
jgi:serine/threonine protein phosphatase PrpC